MTSPLINSIDRKLKRIDDLAEKKEDEQQKEYYNKYKFLYDICIDFLQTKKVLLYGGTAINELMPANMKVYKGDVLPDIDVFCVNALSVATQLSKLYKKHGHISSVQEAIHPGTYKVYANGLQILDCTRVTKSDFKKLSKGKVVGDLKIPICNPEYIRMTLHEMLSQPNDVHRWKKVYARLVHMYKVYPPKTCPPSVKKQIGPKQSIPVDVVQSILEEVHKKEYVMFGGNVISHFFNTPAEVFSWPLGSYLDLLCTEDPVSVATKLVESMNNPYLKVTRVYKDDSVSDIGVPDHVYVTYKHKRLLGIYKMSSCRSYIEMNGYRFASLHTMCTMYLALSWSKFKHHSKQHHQCILHTLQRIQLSLLKEPSRQKLLQEFVMQCYGSVEGMATMRRHRAIRGRK